MHIQNHKMNSYESIYSCKLFNSSKKCYHPLDFQTDTPRSEIYVMAENMSVKDEYRDDQFILTIEYTRHVCYESCNSLFHCDVEDSFEEINKIKNGEWED